MLRIPFLGAFAGGALDDIFSSCRRSLAPPRVAPSVRPQPTSPKFPAVAAAWSRVKPACDSPATNFLAATLA